MSERFQIEDLIVQDASGVVFRAIDTESSKTVAVRRFFPFGFEGGGLHPDEQTAYNIAVDRLAGLSHPALRSVITGGCDPVDGMPYITTEWVEGESILPIIDRAPLSVEDASELITQALEVCELLSHVLAEEAVWVETDLQTIVLGDDTSGRRFTFWISPLKWLGGSTEDRGLDAIITLTEEIMGWKGQVLNDQAGRGLGGWLKWLRETAGTTSLLEAREMLAASIGVEPPDPAPSLVAKATRPLAPSKRRSSRIPLFTTLGLALILGLGGWFWIQNHKANPQSKNPATAETQTPSHPSAALAETNRRAAELSTQAQQADQQQAATLDLQKQQTEQQGGVISWDNHELLVENHRKPVIVEGTFEAIGYSSSGKTMYLRFSETPDRNSAQGAIILSSAPENLSAAAITPLIGKTLRLHGTVDVQRSAGLERPDIKIKDRASIELAE